MTNLTSLGIRKAHALLRQGQVSSVELTQAILDRIVAIDDDIKAYLTLAPESALEQASAADQRRATGEERPLLGVPLAVEDVICVEGLPTTCGSRILEDYIPPTTQRSRKSYRQLVLSFWARPTPTNSPWVPPPRTRPSLPRHNPWDLSRVPGGSSGGSAAAVAACMAYGALGSDTGGSVRQPASSVWSGGRQAHLWPSQPLRAGGLCVFAGSDRLSGQDVADAAIYAGDYRRA